LLFFQNEVGPFAQTPKIRVRQGATRVLKHAPSINIQLFFNLSALTLM